MKFLYLCALYALLHIPAVTIGMLPTTVAIPSPAVSLQDRQGWKREEGWNI